MPHDPEPRNIEAEVREKVKRGDIVHLVLWVPEENDVAEIDLSTLKFDEDLNLTDHGREEVQRHLRRMYAEEEHSSIPDDERKIEF